MFSPIALSNRRVSNDQPDLKTTSTNGTIHISDEVMLRCGLSVGDAIFIEKLATENTGLESTLPGEGLVSYFMKGVKSDPNKHQSAVGNTITFTNNKNVVSAANVYQNLGGNSENLKYFDVLEAVYGLRSNGNPITIDSPEDDEEGVEVYAYVATTNDKGITTIALERVASVAEAKASLPFFPILFTEEKAKQIKGAGDVTPTATAKSTKAAKPVVEVDLDGFDD